jgi:hypothetical protein
MNKWHVFPVLGAAAAVSVIAIASGLDTMAVFIYTTWVLVICALVSLVLYRVMLLVYDRRARALGMPVTHPVHQWFVHRENLVDHIGIPLSVFSLLYTVAVTMFIVSRIIDTAIRKAMMMVDTLH